MCKYNCKYTIEGLTDINRIMECEFEWAVKRGGVIDIFFSNNKTKHDIHFRINSSDIDNGKFKVGDVLYSFKSVCEDREIDPRDFDTVTVKDF